MVNLKTDNSEGLHPAKTLAKLPTWLSEDKVKQFKQLRIIDMGNLNTMKRLMTEKTDFKNPHDNSSMKNGSWHGTNTWGDYLTLLDKGDDKVIEKIKVSTGVKVKELSKKYAEVISNYKFDVTGQFFDIGLVVTGVPEAWLEPEIDIDEGDNLCVEIVINGSFNCMVDEDMVVEHSARILAITKILEDNGVQVGLKLLSTNTNYRHDSEHSDETLIGLVSLKEYDEPINYMKLSAILTPAFHRRAMFKVMELQTEKGNISGSYGQPMAIDGFVVLDNKSSIDKLEQRLFKKGE